MEQFRRVANNNPNPNPNRNTFDAQNFEGPNLARIIPQQVRGDPRRLIAYLCFRLFQDPLTPRDTQTFIKYVSDHGTDDETLRELLHLMMSTPQYQLT